MRYVMKSGSMYKTRTGKISVPPVQKPANNDTRKDTRPKRIV